VLVLGLLRTQDGAEPEALSEGYQHRFDPALRAVMLLLEQLEVC